MAETATRLLTLLSLLAARHTWTGSDLAARLEVSTRTMRRDLECLRRLGYSVRTIKGPDGGYELVSGRKLPPLLLDDEQAIAISVALQTAPASVVGIDAAAARALSSLKQIVPPHVRTEIEALQVTAIPNSWEFPAPPMAPETLRAVGSAVRMQQLLRFDYHTANSPELPPGEDSFQLGLQIEPHHLVIWAARWYLVGFSEAAGWCIYRVDRIRPLSPSGVSFEHRELPTRDVADYVRATYDRGDTPANWQCLGAATLNLAPDVVSRWAPGGSVVEFVSPTKARLTLGAWSWAGIAGLLATFDTDLSDVEPAELRKAFDRLGRRFLRQE